MSLRTLVCLAAAALLASGCIPYTVGTTAHPVQRGRVASSTSIYFIPNGVSAFADSAAGGGATFTSIDMEGRFGIDDASDVGVRVPGGSGIVANYKRRLSQNADHGAPAVAALVGAGLVNFGEHAHFELSVIGSAGERETLTPYGGLRAMQVVPLSRSAVSDSPTIGLFGGVRIGSLELGFSPELGLYYDRSALGLRASSFIVVPAVTVHGRGLLSALGF